MSDWELCFELSEFSIEDIVTSLCEQIDKSLDISAKERVADPKLLRAEPIWVVIQLNKGKLVNNLAGNVTLLQNFRSTIEGLVSEFLARIMMVPSKHVPLLLLWV